ncbi:type II toxin-antitoxin system HicB family antitoxin [Tardiphaga sp.]|uniref:type II toxin-antitoxin system HicB family antitoxin n=1 Tax=Tardiphaga sp. TaxID=1926292 RepID=UPI0025F0BC4A|nr:type II toxin-antitoxin system HicB family antitoxin [Tardiphaga sp.]
MNLLSRGAMLGNEEAAMKIKIVIHDAEEGGYWAEAPAIPGCASQGETMGELILNLREAIAGCLAIEVEPATSGGEELIMELSA